MGQRNENNATSDDHIFERSGHFPMIEEQDQFDSGLLDWLARSVSSQPDRKPASGSEQARQQ